MTPGSRVLTHALTLAWTRRTVPDTTLPDHQVVPPCALIRTDTGNVCGRPAVIRVRAHCLWCGSQFTHFLCKRCYRALRDKKVSCQMCDEMVQLERVL